MHCTRNVRIKKGSREKYYPSTFASTFEEIQNKLTKLSIQVVELKQQHAKDTFLDRLIQCESQGNSKAINYDDAKITGSPSFGILQFQPKTLLSAGKQYGFFPREFTLKELMLIIYNPQLQKDIAEKLLADGQWRHWTNCSLKIGIT